MAIVDQQGRLFGRLNLLDAAFILLLFALIPLGYASWIVFRTPAARLTSVEPATLLSEPSVRIVVHGVNLRPFMRVSLGSRQGADFLFRDSSEAEARFLNMAPGVYDLILYDFEKERDRLPKAVTITATPVPTTQMTVVGWLGNLKQEQAPQVKAGTVIEGFGEITAVGRPQTQSTRVFSGSDTVEVRDPNARRVPVTVRMGCNVRSREGHPVCVVGEVDLKPGALLMSSTPFGLLPFQVEQLRSSAPVEHVRASVRFQADPRQLDMIRKGDVDVVRATNELATGAEVTDVSAAHATTREATLDVQAQREPSGWVYGNAPLRVGAPLTLRTPSYELSGVVLTVEGTKAP